MDSWTVLGLGVLGVAVSVLVGWWLGSVRGRPKLGAFLGLVGVIGWVIVLMLPRRHGPYGPPVEADLHIDDASARPQ